MRFDPAFAYLRDLAERATSIRPEPDHDGDLPIRIHGALFYARVVGDSDAWIQVFSIAAQGLSESPDLAMALNDINRQVRFARVVHVAEQVLFETEIWADDLNPSNFNHACRNIARATDTFGHRLVQAFGGQPVFEESKGPEYVPPDDEKGLGFYL